jgi:drug/metabolite transporter (DMT)-like permease
MYFSSVKELKGQEVAILSYIDPLVAVIVSLIFLKETMGVFQIIGGVLILGFSVLNEIKFNKK